MSQFSQNPYQSPYNDSYATTAALAAESERATFIRRTYLHLAAAVLLFAGIEALIFISVEPDTLKWFTMRAVGGWTWLLFLGGFMVVSWIARSWAASDTSVGMQYLGLLLYVVAQSILFVPLLTMAAFFCKDPNVIPSAGILTLSMFAGLTAVAFISRKDFSFLRNFLVVGGMIAMGLIVCSMFLGGISLGIWFSVALIVLASGYILYDTSNVMHHYRTTQHVAAALALFASVALLFWYLIQLLMLSRR